MMETFYTSQCGGGVILEIVHLLSGFRLNNLFLEWWPPPFKVFRGVNELGSNKQDLVSSTPKELHCTFELYLPRFAQGLDIDSLPLSWMQIGETKIKTLVWEDPANCGLGLCPSFQQLDQYEWWQQMCSPLLLPVTTVLIHHSILYFPHSTRRLKWVNTLSHLNNLVINAWCIPNEHFTAPPSSPNVKGCAIPSTCPSLQQGLAESISYN